MLSSDALKASQFVAKLSDLTASGLIRWNSAGYQRFEARVEEGTVRVRRETRRALSTVNAQSAMKMPASSNESVTTYTLEVQPSPDMPGSVIEEVPGLADLFENVSGLAPDVSSFIDKVLA